MAGGSPPEASPRLGGHPAFLPIPAWDITPGGFAGKEQRPPGHGCTPTPLLLGVPGSIPGLWPLPVAHPARSRGRGRWASPLPPPTPGDSGAGAAALQHRAPSAPLGVPWGSRDPLCHPDPSSEQRREPGDLWLPAAPPGQMIPPLQRRVLGCWMLHSLLGIPLGIP